MTSLMTLTMIGRMTSMMNLRVLNASSAGATRGLNNANGCSPVLMSQEFLLHAAAIGL
jgi:hypothetical protein